jgi:hypothetical protein
LWSGLVLRREGKFAESTSEFSFAIKLGYNH